MTLHQLLQGLLQQLHIQFAADAVGGVDIKNRIGPFQLVEKPETLLRKGAERIAPSGLELLLQRRFGGDQPVAQFRRHFTAKYFVAELLPVFPKLHSLRE